VIRSQHAPHLNWSGLIGQILSEQDLAPDEAAWAMAQMMSGSASSVQIAGFLVAMKSKGPSGAELAAFVDAMLEFAVPVEISGVAVDTCGTGGDHLGTVNISTMSAVAVAASGVQVVKHGNRAATSKSGSADVLEELGIRIDLQPDEIVPCLQAAGIAFCFAPVFHPAMRHAGPVRRELGVPTVFNVLGPLANPARPAAQVVGVADPMMAPQVARALHQRGTSALVLRGEDGLDEWSTMATTRVWDCRGSEIVEIIVSPEDLGLDRAPNGALAGGEASINAAIAREALSASPSVEFSEIVDSIVVNAAAALICVDAVTAESGQLQKPDLVAEMIPAMDQVRVALGQGRGSQVLRDWAEATRN
jgi:anthranilate phosphoribosyltransferase